MLEENTTYSYEEMSAYLGTRNNQGIERKLRNYGVEFTRTRRGATAQYTIKHLADPFKLCAVFDFGFPCNTDIDKLTEYTYYLINDDEFSGWPDERLEQIMTDRGHRVYTSGDLLVPSTGCSGRISVQTKHSHSKTCFRNKGEVMRHSSESEKKRKKKE